MYLFGKNRFPLWAWSYFMNLLYLCMIQIHLNSGLENRTWSLSGQSHYMAIFGINIWPKSIPLYKCVYIYRCIYRYVYVVCIYIHTYTSVYIHTYIVTWIVVNVKDQNSANPKGWYHGMNFEGWVEADM